MDVYYKVKLADRSEKDLDEYPVVWEGRVDVGPQIPALDDNEVYLVSSRKWRMVRAASASRDSSSSTLFDWRVTARLCEGAGPGDGLRACGSWCPSRLASVAG